MKYEWQTASTKRATDSSGSDYTRPALPKGSAPLPNERVQHGYTGNYTYTNPYEPPRGMEVDRGPLGAWQPFGMAGRDGEYVMWRRRLCESLAAALGED